MPELPEVESIKNALSAGMVGCRISGIELFWQKAVHEPSAEEFCRRVIGQNINGIRRRGKYLLFQLSDSDTLIIHLKMSGVLLLEPISREPRHHTTAIFRLDGGSELHFIDQRKFGSLWLVADENMVIGRLGPEPLNESFTPGVLASLLSRHRVPVKALLLDQHAIAGVGNMYADEALFAASIHPLKRAGSLSDDEIHRLHGAIIEVLERGIRHNGASINTYRLPDGTEGFAHTQFRVAHRRGETCLVCGSPITRIAVRGRGTYFCPKCQRDE